MKFKIVIEPYSLLWPDAFMEDDVRQYRGQAGYIVDTDAPCETVFLAGQEHKLRDLTKKEIDAYEARFKRPVVPGAIKYPMALAAIAAENAGAVYEPFEVAKKIKENEEAAELAAEIGDLGIPEPETADEAEWED